MSIPPRGRQFFANPGPTNIPDSVLREMARPVIDFASEEFAALFADCLSGLRRVIGTSGEVFLYTASGHGAWEATLANLFSPGDVVLVVESGVFSESWTAMMRAFGLDVRTLGCDWREGPDMARLEAALREDKAQGGHIRAVACVHSETSIGMSLDLPAVRATIDAAGHEALLLVDTISSLGSLEYRMDEWGIDATVGGSQKGLMLPTGFSFTAAGPRAMAAHRTARLPRAYFDWTGMMTRRERSFTGTIPVSLFFGLRESLRRLDEEGLEQVVARHHRLASATRAAIRAWGGNDGPQLFPLDAARASDSVSAMLMPEGHDADAVRRDALSRFNVTFGGGLSRLGGRVLRIGHLGDLNEPMLLGALAALEMSLGRCGVPHGRGGVAAAMELLAA